MIKFNNMLGTAGVVRREKSCSFPMISIAVSCHQHVTISEILES